MAIQPVIETVPSKMLSLSTGRESAKLRHLVTALIPNPSFLCLWSFSVSVLQGATWDVKVHFAVPLTSKSCCWLKYVALSLRWFKLPAEGGFHFPSPSWAVHSFWPIRTENAWKTIKKKWQCELQKGWFGEGGLQQSMVTLYKSNMRSMPADLSAFTNKPLNAWRN